MIMGSVQNVDRSSSLHHRSDDTQYASVTVTASGETSSTMDNPPNLSSIMNHTNNAQEYIVEPDDIAIINHAEGIDRSIDMQLHRPDSDIPENDEQLYEVVEETTTTSPRQNCCFPCLKCMRKVWNLIVESTLFNISVGSFLLMLGIGISSITFNNSKNQGVLKVLMIGPALVGFGLLLVVKGMVINVRSGNRSFRSFFSRCRRNRSDGEDDDDEDVEADPNETSNDGLMREQERRQRRRRRRNGHRSRRRRRAALDTEEDMQLPSDDSISDEEKIIPPCYDDAIANATGEEGMEAPLTNISGGEKSHHDGANVNAIVVTINNSSAPVTTTTTIIVTTYENNVVSSSALLSTETVYPPSSYSQHNTMINGAGHHQHVSMATILPSRQQQYQLRQRNASSDEMLSAINTTTTDYFVSPSSGKFVTPLSSSSSSFSTTLNNPANYPVLSSLSSKNKNNTQVVIGNGYNQSSPPSLSSTSTCTARIVPLSSYAVTTTTTTTLSSPHNISIGKAKLSSTTVDRINRFNNETLAANTKPKTKRSDSPMSNVNSSSVAQGAPSSSTERRLHGNNDDDGVAQKRTKSLKLSALLPRRRSHSFDDGELSALVEEDLPPPQYEDLISAGILMLNNDNESMATSSARATTEKYDSSRKV